MVERDSVLGTCIKLKHDTLSAVVAPEMGMSLISFCVEDIEIMAHDRRAEFLSSRKGYGPLILPHFNQNAPIPEIDASAFAHVKGLQSLNIKHPFQHGIGRYAPWRFEEQENGVVGRLSGSDVLNGYELRQINGFDFQAEVCYRLSSEGLNVILTVEGEKPVQAGLHFYYDLKERSRARILMMDEENHEVEYRFDIGYDLPVKPPASGERAIYRLETPSYVLDTCIRVAGRPEEIFQDWIIYSPAETTFVCVEPISTLTPAKRVNQFNGSVLLKPKKKGGGESTS